MGEIKRYKIDLECRSKAEQWGRNLLLDASNGDLVKYLDHKAVVEIKDKEIQVLETTLNFRDESIVKMQNKIDELEKKLERVRDELRKESDKCYKNNDSFGQKIVGRLWHNLAWALAKGIK